MSASKIRNIHGLDVFFGSKTYRSVKPQDFCLKNNARRFSPNTFFAKYHSFSPLTLKAQAILQLSELSRVPRCMEAVNSSQKKAPLGNKAERLFRTRKQKNMKRRMGKSKLGKVFGAWDNPLSYPHDEQTKTNAGTEFT